MDSIVINSECYSRVNWHKVIYLNLIMIEAENFILDDLAIVNTPL